MAGKLHGRLNRQSALARWATAGCTVAVLTFLLQAVTAAGIAAPVPFDRAVFVQTPTLAARALSVATLPTPPATPDPPPAWRLPSFDPAFLHANPRALAALKAKRRLTTGEESVGRETRLGLRWVLPE